MRSLIHSSEAGVFHVLRDEKFFRQVRITLSAVTWPGDLDLAPHEMHRAITEFGTWTHNTHGFADNGLRARD